MVLRVVLGLMAGSILGAILGFVVWIGNATPIIRSPIEVFTILGAAGAALLALRTPRGMGVGKVSFVIVLLTLIGCAAVAFVLAQLMWHQFQRGMFHP